MRKIILLTMIAFSALSFGQSLVVTPIGLKDSIDNEKSYVVINAQGKTAKELYENAIKYINKNYKSPNDVIKGKIEGEYLSFITHASSIAYAQFYPTKSYGKHQRSFPYDLKYTVELNFKDGKVKYEIISLSMVLSSGEPNYELHFIEDKGFIIINPGIYSKEGVVINGMAKRQIEAYYNSQIKSLALALNVKDNNESW